MESIIEKYSMNREMLERERINLEEANRDVFRDIEHNPRFRLTRLLYRNLEIYKTEIHDLERQLIEYEADLERVQHKISEIEHETPYRDFSSPIQSEAYDNYRDYLTQETRLKKYIKSCKKELEEKETEKKTAEENIKALETYPGQEERDARMRENYLEISKKVVVNNEIDKGKPTQGVKHARKTVTPLSRIYAHGPHFADKFKDLIHGFAPMGGRKTRKRTRRRKNK